MGVVEGKKQVLPDRREIRSEIDRAPEISDRLLLFAALALQRSDPHVGLGSVRRKLEHLAITIARFRQALELLEGPAALHERIHVLGVAGKISVQFLQPVRVTGEIDQGIGKAKPRLIESRFQFESAPVASDRLFEASLALQQRAEIVVRQGKIRGELDRFTIAFFGLVEAAERVERPRQVELESGMVWGQCEGALVVRERLVQSAERLQGDCGVIVSVDGVWLECERALVRGERFLFATEMKENDSQTIVRGEVCGVRRDRQTVV